MLFMRRCFAQREEKNVHLFKKLPPGCRNKRRFFLSSPYYFPEHTVISSIFHAYGHECLTLPCLCVNKKEISWLKFSLEEQGKREKPAKLQSAATARFSCGEICIVCLLARSLQETRNHKRVFCFNCILLCI